MLPPPDLRHVLVRERAPPDAAELADNVMFPTTTHTTPPLSRSLGTRPSAGGERRHEPGELPYDVLHKVLHDNAARSSTSTTEGGRGHRPAPIAAREGPGPTVARGLAGRRRGSRARARQRLRHGCTVLKPGGLTAKDIGQERPLSATGARRWVSAAWRVAREGDDFRSGCVGFEPPLIGGRRVPQQFEQFDRLGEGGVLRELAEQADHPGVCRGDGTPPPRRQRDRHTAGVTLDRPRLTRDF